MGRGSGGQGELRGNRQKEMEIPVIRMCDAAMYASYEGWYGEGGGRIRDRMAPDF